MCEPGFGDRVVGLDGDRSVSLNRDRTGERPTVELAADIRREAGETVPRGPVRDRLLEERDRFGVCFAALQRPAQGQGGELANFGVRLAVERAGLLECVADVNAVASWCRGRPDGRPVRRGL